MSHGPLVGNYDLNDLFWKGTEVCSQQGSLRWVMNLPGLNVKSITVAVCGQWTSGSGTLRSAPVHNC